MPKRKPAREPELDRVCGQCGKRAPVMMEMAADPPWYLCAPCWREPFVKIDDTGASE